MTTTNNPVRVRFAPSPTGFLHVGGARTAIFNDLLSQSLGGTFVLRIEDTDQKRSDEAMTRQIQDGLDWVGVQWDEGPFLQRQGTPRHRQDAQRLLESGRAYPCFCTPEVLDSQRREAEKKGERFRYPRTCAGLSAQEVAERQGRGEPFVLRLRMPDEVIRFHDVIRGDVEFPPIALDDFILLRKDGSPTYHLSVVSDDIEMGITHVVRGEDHLSNTPKHVVLFQALEAELPVFAHLPLILGPNKKRLSKRTGATSVEEFRDAGILPQALYNYLALLGWSPGDDRELLSRQDLIEAFSLERVGSHASVFDPEKLTWMNGQYMWSLSVDELLEPLVPFLEQEGLGAEVGTPRLRRIVELQQPRARTLQELARSARVYYQDDLVYPEERCQKFVENDDLPAWLQELARRYEAAEPFDTPELEAILRELAEELEVKAGVLIHPTRMALSASREGPPLFDLVEVLGRETVAHRLGRFIELLRERQGA
jgi:glutamyl-tRNA synthetase